jgi:hypothetical protein
VRARRRHHRQVRGGHQRTLRPGTKVLLRARADYDIHFGFSLTVEDIDPADAGHRATCISKRGPSWYWAGSAPDWLTVDEPVRSGSPLVHDVPGQGPAATLRFPQLTMSHPARATRWFTMFQGASASGAFRFTMFQIERGAPLWFTMLQDELLHLGK